MKNKKLSVAAIIVSYNGLHHLKIILDLIRNQSYKLDEIIVVDNGSSDGTGEWIKENKKDITLISQDNLGSSGGQFNGLLYAYKKGYDFFWCLDNDIYAEKDALQKLLKVFQHKERTGFISSCILGEDRKIAYSNMPELDKSEKILNDVNAKDSISIISGSFGSLLIKREVLEKCGLPVKEFFIWGDDAEFTLRIINNGYNGYLAMDSICIHRQQNIYDNSFANLELNNVKMIFGLRNMTYVNLLRNKIVSKSALRGLVSAFMYYLRIIKRRKELHKEPSIVFIGKTFYIFLKGLFLKPVVKYPQEL